MTFTSKIIDTPSLLVIVNIRMHNTVQFSLPRPALTLYVCIVVLVGLY